MDFDFALPTLAASQAWVTHATTAVYDATLASFSAQIDFADEYARTMAKVAAKELSPTHAAKALRAPNARVLATRLAEEAAPKMLAASRIARGASLVAAEVELSFVSSDNPELEAHMRHEVEEAKLSGGWGCEKYLWVVDVCGPTRAPASAPQTTSSGQ